MTLRQRYAIAFGLSALVHGALFLSLRPLSHHEVQDLEQTLVEIQIDEPPPEEVAPPPPPPPPPAIPTPVTDKTPEPVTPAPADPSLAERQDTTPPPPVPTPVAPVAVAPSPAASPTSKSNGPPNSTTVSEVSVQQLDSKDFKPFGNRRPPYPEAARALGLEGSVKLEVLVGPKGSVEQVRILEVRGHPSFGESAKRAASQWRFVPPRSKGQAARVWFRQEIDFKLRE